MRFRAVQHLRRQSDFRRVRESGRRLPADALSLWWLPAADQVLGNDAGVRLGVVASAHAVGGAVQRNRAKRRLREIFRRHQNEIPARGDLLMVARPAMNSQPFAAIEQNAVAALRRLRGTEPHV